MVYRIWSESRDAYETEELTEAEVSKWLLAEAMEDAKREIDRRIGQAREKGTSSYIDDPHDLNGSWEQERKDEDIEDDEENV